jgi:hypothetical protein
MEENHFSESSELWPARGEKNWRTNKNIESQQAI